MFSKLEANIRALEAQQTAISALAEQLQADCFDDEDRATVQQKLVSVTESKAKVEATLARKREIYKTQILGMEQQLSQRHSKLETQQAVFEAFPDVLEYFARKQSVLTESLASIKTHLQSG